MTGFVTTSRLETDYSNASLDLTVYGRQEAREDSPAGWRRRSGITGEQHAFSAGGRPIAQWARLRAGHSDQLRRAGL
jgi:hypothetical protein